MQTKYSVSKKVVHKLFSNIFTEAKCISIKYCDSLLQIYAHTYLLILFDLPYYLAKSRRLF